MKNVRKRQNSRSENIKAAMADAKAHGVKVGGQRRRVLGKDKKGRKIYGERVVISDDARSLSKLSRKRQAEARAAEIAPAIEGLKAAGVVSLRAIALGLNKQAIPTPRGTGQWSATQVARILEWMCP